MKSSKRRFLQLCGTIAASATLAGCSSDDEDGNQPASSPENGQANPSPTDTATTTPTTEDTETPINTEEEETPTPADSEDTPTPETDGEPSFELQDIRADDVAAADDAFEVLVSVANNGDGSGTVTVELTLADSRVASEATIPAGDTTGVTAEISTESLDPGRYEMTAQFEDQMLSKSVDILEIEGSGVYGSAVSVGEADITDAVLQMVGRQTSEQEIESTQFDENGQFRFPHLFDRSYDISLTFKKLQAVAENFTGLPVLYDLENQYSVTEDIDLVGRYEIPEAYRTEVQLVDENGTPIEDFSAVGFRTGNGAGTGNTFTTNEEGYVIRQGGAQTGVWVENPPPGGSRLKVVARLKGDGFEEELRRIYGSEAGEEFVIEVANPDRFVRQ